RSERYRMTVVREASVRLDRNGNNGGATAVDGPAAAGHPRLGFFQRRFGRWIALSQYGFPFSIWHYSSPVSRFRALARRTRLPRRSPPLRMLAAAAMT